MVEPGEAPEAAPQTEDTHKGFKLGMSSSYLRDG